MHLKFEALGSHKIGTHQYACPAYFNVVSDVNAKMYAVLIENDFFIYSDFVRPFANLM